MTPTELRPRALALLAVLLALLPGCLGPDRPPRRPGTEPRTLFSGGRVRLQAGGEPVEALLVQHGRVVAAGDLETLLARPDAREWRRVDLRGGTAVPGLQDAHGHWEGLGEALESVDLRGATTYDEVVRRVAAQAARQPAGSWVLGRGWDQNLWPDPIFPNHEPLSAAVPDHPVLVRRIDGHAALCNARALALAELDGDLRASPVTVQGGDVLLDERGRASGVLVDSAMALVAQHVPRPDRATRRRRILRAQEELLALGLTAVHDMGVDREAVEIFLQLREEGLLKLRSVAYWSASPALAAGELGPIPEDERDRFCVKGVKLYADGALGSRGAALLEAYSDDPGNRGLLVTEPDELAAAVRRCAELGLQPAVHAIGDRAVRLVLDVFEAELARDAGLAELRPRVEHAQIVHPDDAPRFAALGVVPSVQPTHATSDMPWVPARLGEARLPEAYPWRALAPDPSVLALGSDFPVERASPMEGLYAARTRRDREGEPPGGWLPDQVLSAREALDGFTAGAARAALQEGRRGVLQPGYPADLTVLDVDPVTCAPEELLAARVLLTVIDGEVVHDAGAEGAPAR